MSNLRWASSEREAVQVGDVEDYALEITENIMYDQYDGYKTRNLPVAEAVSFHLSLLSKSRRWSVYAETTTDSEGLLFSVWVQRAPSVHEITVGDWVWDTKVRSYGQITYFFPDRPVVELKDTRNLWETERYLLLPATVPE